MENKEGLIWYNGNLIDWKDAKLHVLTHGLHYASSVFEGERSYSGRIFKLHEHTERLFFSASQLDFEIPYTIEEIKENSNIQIITQDKTDEGIFHMLDELIVDFKEQDNLKTIESLEKKLINNLDESSYSELIRLKSQINSE